MRSLLFSLLTLCTLAHAAPHDHGSGRLDVAIEGATITINLELPLDAAVGFERAPRNAKEKAVLQDAAKRLAEGSAMFQPNAEAACNLKNQTLRVPHLDGAAAGEHADIEAQYRFECANANALNAIASGLFKAFPRLYRVETQRIGPKGQGGARLTPKNPVLRW